VRCTAVRAVTLAPMSGIHLGAGIEVDGIERVATAATRSPPTGRFMTPSTSGAEHRMVPSGRKADGLGATDRCADDRPKALKSEHHEVAHLGRQRFPEARAYRLAVSSTWAVYSSEWL